MPRLLTQLTPDRHLYAVLLALLLAALLLLLKSDMPVMPGLAG